MRSIVLTALLVFAAPAWAAQTDGGSYQMVLGDCRGCHGKNLAGGITLETPFGRLVTPNITPDKETGIGNYTGEDFRQAMKNGIAPSNKLLYPAMPYPSYARMSDADVAALWSYLKTIKPVKHRVEVNQLKFPFSLRFLMRGWNLFFFRPAPYADDPAKTAAWNRGAYLVGGPAHCGACHTPKNFFGADKDVALTGALLEGWFAPDLTANRDTGLGSWSKEEIVGYLQTGGNAHSIASGPMAEAVENSTSQMTSDDLNAIAFYLKDLPASAGHGANGGMDESLEAQVAAGRALYDINCAACHSRDGKGSKLFPPLSDNANIRQEQPDTIVRIVLAGSKAAATHFAPTGASMPSLGWKLSDEQVADILSYVRNNWGNRAPAVSPSSVGQIRSALHSAS
jgi:mono/diheme cytochrome c family protein